MKQRLSKQFWISIVVVIIEISVVKKSRGNWIQRDFLYTMLN